MNQEIVNMLTLGESCTLVNEENLRSKRPASFTALISGSSGVFTMYTGKVEYVGKYEGMYSYNILMNDHELFRYLYLDSVEAWGKGQELGPQVKLGVPRRNKPFGFEYCTQWQGTSSYPIRINNRTYFLQNPIDILDGIYVPPAPIEVIEATTPNQAEYDFDMEEIDSGEWILDMTEEEFNNTTVGEDDVPRDEIESCPADFDQPAAELDLDKVDDFSPTDYLIYIQSKENSEDEG